MTSNLDGNAEHAELVLVDLIASFASANGVAISLGFSLSQGLARARILFIEVETETVTCGSEDAIFNFIVSHSYPRGDYVARLVSSRICKAIKQINSKGGTRFLDELNAADFGKSSAMLLPLYGVGPRFVENYCILRGIYKS